MVGGLLVFALVLSFACAQIDLPPSGYRFTREGTEDYNPLSVLVAPVGQTFTDIDASFQRRSTGMIYFTKGTAVWSVPDPKYVVLGVMNGLGGELPPSFSIYEYWPNLETGLAEPVTKIDAFVESLDGTLYIFTGNYVFHYRDARVGSKSDETLGPREATRGTGWEVYRPPRRIAHAFTGLPSNIDAAVQTTSGTFYFFKGTSYYRVPVRSIYGPALAEDDLGQPMRVENCDPSSIAAGWELSKPVTAAFKSISSKYLIFLHADGSYTSIKEKFLLTEPTKDVQYIAATPLSANPPLTCVGQAPLDAATLAALTGEYDAIFQRRNGKIYIFIGDSYYRLTDRLHTPHPWDCLDEGYPKLIKDNFAFDPSIDFKLTPVDAVFQRSNGKIYFFVGNEYHRFSDKYLDAELDPTTVPDALDYTHPIVGNFGFETDPTLIAPINSVYQKVDGKIYIFLDDAAKTVFRLSDKYLVGGANDHIDEEYETAEKNFLTEFEVAPFKGPIRNVYQRTETDTKIHVLGGAAAGAPQLETVYFDQTLQWTEPCTACTKNPAATD